MRVDHCHCHRSMQPYYFLKEKNHKTYNYSYSYLNISSFHQPTCFLESFQVGRGPSQLKGEQCTWCSQIYWREPWMYNPQLQHYPHSLVLLNIQCQYYRQYYYWLNTWFSTIASTICIGWILDVSTIILQVMLVPLVPLPSVIDPNMVWFAQCVGDNLQCKTCILIHSFIPSPCLGSKFKISSSVDNAIHKTNESTGSKGQALKMICCNFTKS